MREGGEPYTVDALEMMERDGFDSFGIPKSINTFFSIGRIYVLVLSRLRLVRAPTGHALITDQGFANPLQNPQLGFFFGFERIFLI
jgi:hypothetical protein